MINQLFAVAMLVLGVLLMLTNFQIDNALKGDKCDDTQLKNCNKGILVIGTVAVVASLSYLMCQSRCGQGQAAVFETEMYAGFCLALGIVIVVLASIIQSRAGAVPQCADAKKHTTLIIILGVVMILGAGGYLGMYAYENMGGREAYKRLRGSGFKGSSM
jgi:drug/metabolite transporter (DMT)-like permease